MLRRWRLVLYRVDGVCLGPVSVIVLAAAQSHEELGYRIEVGRVSASLTTTTRQDSCVRY
jgi:hypothetical protein